MCIKTGEIWENFVLWAKNHGVEFRATDDYELLWKCFYDATNQALKISKECSVEKTYERE